MVGGSMIGMVGRGILGILGESGAREGRVNVWADALGVKEGV